ncbi:phosphoglycerate mutase-like protein [Venturia nashicola]|uniref:Phosphoglycerate mutase-like protein n=1 Tax=Venturia nashicola TaxID=86259 RepID=A0A4Z1PVE5_9PEZI|nr:phosphoglycerate mutase-like protein [Venturia nashicola]
MVDDLAATACNLPAQPTVLLIPDTLNDIGIQIQPHHHHQASLSTTSLISLPQSPARIAYILTAFPRDYSLHDPVLSDLGIEQCKQLHEHLIKNETLYHDVQLIVVSPMRRTLQTADIALSDLIKKQKVDVKLDGGWQETSDMPCDTGSPLPTISAEFPQFDFSKVDPGYPTKQGPYAFTRSAVLQRGQTVLRSLHRRPERVIIVVSHSGFLRTAVTSKQFGNADYRIYDFDEHVEPKTVDGVEIKYRLKERYETDSKGGGMGWSEIGHFGITDEDFPLIDPIKRGPDEVVDEVPELQ